MTARDATLDRAAWPLSDVGDAVAALAARCRLGEPTGEPPALPAGVGDDPDDLDRFLGFAGRRAGIEADPVDLPLSTLATAIADAAPLLLSETRGGTTLVHAVVSVKRERVSLLSPGGSVVTVPVGDLCERLAGPRIEARSASVDPLLDLARLRDRRRSHVRWALLSAHLDGASAPAAWTLRPCAERAGGSLSWRRLAPGLAMVLTLLVVLAAADAGAWWLIGSAVLDGRLQDGWLAAFLLLLGTLIPLRMGAALVQSRLILDFGLALKRKLFSAALALDPAVVRREGGGGLIGRVMEAGAFEALILGSGLTLLVAAVELPFAGAVLVAGAGGLWHLALLTLFLVATVMMTVRHHRILVRWTRRRTALAARLIERMAGHRTALAQDVAATRDRETDVETAGYVEATAVSDRSAVALTIVPPAIFPALAVATLALAAAGASPGALAIAVGGAMLAARSLAGLTGGLATAARAGAAFAGLKPILAGTRTAEAAESFIPAAAMTRAEVPVLQADGVVYRRSDRGAAVIRNASLHIAAGDRLLLEGASGAGKSTLAALFAGLERPEAGSVRLAGFDRATLGASWRRFATTAPQFHENHVLSAPLAFNLLMGRRWPARPEDLAEARSLCDDLGLGDLIERMPAGLMQVVGETGWQLSHGEKSRIYLARAILAGAPFTILDESFAALDPETFERCMSVAERRCPTLMLIAHV